MKNITLAEIAKGQKELKVRSFNTDLFKGDRENIEEFDKQAYSEFYLTEMDNVHDQGEHDKLRETVIAVGHESDFYMINAITSSFNGEKQVSFTQQPITLKGFNYFTKALDEDFTEVYNNYLVSKGYELTIEDIVTLGELNTEYNVTTLSFKTDNEDKHYLTVNAKNQLSSVTVKVSDREVKATESTLTSAFA